MIQLAFFLLGAQLKDFKSYAHMNLGYIGPSENQSKEDYAQLFASEGTKVWIGGRVRQEPGQPSAVSVVEEVLEAKFDAEFQELHRTHQPPEKAEFKTYFYFENSLAETQVGNFMWHLRARHFACQHNVDGVVNKIFQFVPGGGARHVVLEGTASISYPWALRTHLKVHFPLVGDCPRYFSLKTFFVLPRLWIYTNTTSTRSRVPPRTILSAPCRWVCIRIATTPLEGSDCLPRGF